MPYSPAIRAGDWLFVSGQLASDFKTGLAPEIRNANANLEGDLYLQSRFVLRNLVNTMREAGCDPARDMVRISEWFQSDRPTLDDMARGDLWPEMDIRAYLDARTELIGRPTAATSALGIKDLLCAGTRVEVDMICRTDESEPQPIALEPAGGGKRDPEHLRGLRRGDWIFLAAHDAADVDGGVLTTTNDWSTSPVEAQVERVLAGLGALAKSAGSSLSRAIKAEVYIGHPQDFAAMDREWRRWFGDAPPARVVVPWVGMGRRGARVQVALTLLAEDSVLPVQVIETDDAPPGLGCEPQAIRAGDLLFLSTQMAFDRNGCLADGMARKPEFPWYGSPSKWQMHYMMDNVQKICEAGGTSLDNIARRVCFHSNFHGFAESIEAWASYFPGSKPASTTLRLGDPLVVPGANTLLDLIAYVPE
ncbi:MAG: RidA family protein [Woeseia sp.]